jgi:RND family efflux transporter MFP subunit
MRNGKIMNHRFFAPALILLVGVWCSAFLVRGQPESPSVASEPMPPAIRILSVRPQSVKLDVHSQGTVSPRTESEIVAQVPGQVLEIGPGLEPGAFFEAGDVLLRLDPRDLEFAQRRAKAALDRARAEEEYANAMLNRRRVLGDSGVASASVIEEALRASRTAAARRVEAEVDLAQAEYNFTRSTIRAPFDGRALDRRIDVGSYVTVGAPIAQLYAVDYAEVRLPIPDAELAYLDLPIGETIAPDAAPRVALTTAFAGETHRWNGRIVRTEARIDPRTRMVHVVARVPRPYEVSPEAPARPPLAAGLFVEAQIEGRTLDGIVRVPRETLYDTGHLYVLDGEDRLRRRRVEVLRLERREALITKGLEASDRVSMLEPRLASEGLVVRPVDPGTLADSGATRRPAS